MAPLAKHLITGVLALHFAIDSVSGQNCYYPNGDVALGMAACSSQGGACCPFNWECLDNGLCYLENAHYFGRYTCTDRDWASESNCPQYCTQGNTAIGNEAIQDCADGSWCCDENRNASRYCCNRSDAEILDITSTGSPTAKILTTSPPTPVSSPRESDDSTSFIWSTPTTEVTRDYRSEVFVYPSGKFKTLTSESTTIFGASTSSPDTSSIELEIPVPQPRVDPDSTSTGSSGPTTTTSSSSSATSTASSSSGSLSTSAKAGVGVGASVAGIAAIAGVVFILVRRKRSYHTDTMGEPQMETRDMNAFSTQPEVPAYRT